MLLVHRWKWCRLTGVSQFPLPWSGSTGCGKWLWAGLAMVRSEGDAQSDAVRESRGYD
jgi:hypothetical protein